MKKVEFIDSPHYSPRGRAKIDLVVIHFTAGGAIESTIEWFKNPASKASAHYVVERDGRIVQMVRENQAAWHAGESSWKGKKGVNKRSIGIEICNWGELKLRDGVLYCWPNGWKRPFGKKERYYHSPTETYWEFFTDAQYESVRFLLMGIRERYPGITIVGHSDVSPGRKVDPGPAFSYAKVL